ncbi:flippase [Herbaspirillum sp.]|uniref:flippase n=1 Tax=Herbaspirillum sp. TaxID=1890675 RepID=UPI001B1B0DE8|nr:flippase [Herbaspirillum sp.]MBO9536963.1 flippase [Herbaspirillum sp.]
MLLKILAKDSAIYGGADFLSKLLAFFSFPLIAAALSPHAFGSLELLVTATALLGMAANCGLNNALQRYYWDSETARDERPVLVSSGLAAQMILAGIAVIAGIGILAIAWPHIDESSTPMSWHAVVAALVLMFANQATQYALDVIRLHIAPWRFLSIAMVSRALSALVGVVVVVRFHWGLDGLLIAQAAASLAVLPIALYMIRADLTLRISRSVADKLMRFGYPFIFSGLAFWLFGSMDRWMLASMSSVDEVGIYSVAYRFASVVMFVSVAFGQAWSPLAMKIRTDHPDKYRTMYADVLMILGCAMLLLGAGVALFSNEIIRLLMPTNYLAAAQPLAILSLGIVLQSTQQITAVGISIEKKTFLFARLSWVAALLNFVLNLILIPRFGASGTALATTLTYLMLTASYMYFTQRLHPLPIPGKKVVGLGSLWIAVFCFAIIPLPVSGLQLYVFKGLIFSLCLFSAYLLIPLRIANHVK